MTEALNPAPGASQRRRAPHAPRRSAAPRRTVLQRFNDGGDSGGANPCLRALCRSCLRSRCPVALSESSASCELNPNRRSITPRCERCNGTTWMIAATWTRTTSRQASNPSTGARASMISAPRTSPCRLRLGRRRIQRADGTAARTRLFPLQQHNGQGASRRPSPRQGEPRTRPSCARWSRID